MEFLATFIGNDAKLQFKKKYKFLLRNTKSMHIQVIIQRDGYSEQYIVEYESLSSFLSNWDNIDHKLKQDYKHNPSKFLY
jgi:hypothetical protein